MPVKGPSQNATGGNHDEKTLSEIEKKALEKAQGDL